MGDQPINPQRDVPVRGNVLSAIYTNDINMMSWYLAQLNGWLEGAKEQERFIGLDLEYTRDQKDVAVIQLCFKKKVLIFQ